MFKSSLALTQAFWHAMAAKLAAAARASSPMVRGALASEFPRLVLMLARLSARCEVAWVGATGQQSTPMAATGEVPPSSSANRKHLIMRALMDAFAGWRRLFFKRASARIVDTLNGVLELPQPAPVKPAVLSSSTRGSTAGSPAIAAPSSVKLQPAQSQKLLAAVRLVAEALRTLGQDNAPPDGSRQVGGR